MARLRPDRIFGPWSVEMGNCGSSSSSGVQLTSAELSERRIQLSQRPLRSGLWFLTHQSELKTISFSEKVDVFAEFFRGHPNAFPLVSEFVAVKLDDAQVASQLHRIRMSSYHWEAVAGIGAEQEYAIPANYEWFLRLIKKRHLLGWIDFVGTMVVNCELHVHMKSMGRLYASIATVGGWAESTTVLTTALKRGWIYQETAYGPIDSGSVESLLQLARTQGKAVLKRGADAATVLAFLQACEAVGKLLARRGFLTLYLLDAALLAAYARCTEGTEGGEAFERMWTTIASPGAQV